jgi:hypothetical protein
MRQGLPERLAQAWLVPRWTTTLPGRELDFGVVQHQREFAFDHDAVVHRFGTVHQRVG